MSSKRKPEVNSGVCPFDNLPCKFVDSCDEILDSVFGAGVEWHCSRRGSKGVKPA